MAQKLALLTAQEVAAELQVSSETVRRWARAGKLDVVTLPSGRMKFRAEDVAALTDRKVEVAS